MTLRKKPFENIVGKGENAGNQHFLLFPQCFLSFPKQISIFGGAQKIDLLQKVLVRKAGSEIIHFLLVC